MLTEEELKNLAKEELLKDAKCGAVRAELYGAHKWARPKMLHANKHFLRNMILSGKRDRMGKNIVRNSDPPKSEKIKSPEALSATPATPKSNDRDSERTEGKMEDKSSHRPNGRSEDKILHKSNRRHSEKDDDKIMNKSKHRHSEKAEDKTEPRAVHKKRKHDKNHHRDEKNSHKRHKKQLAD